MGITRLVAKGRRLMLPSDVEKDDHKRDLTISSEVITYRRPNSDGADLQVLIVRHFHRPVWKWRIYATELTTGQALATTVSEQWESVGRGRIEDELRDMGLIA